MATTMQAKHSHGKGCVLFSMHISNDKGKDVEDEKVFRKYPFSQQFQGVFRVEISKFLPHREVEFSSELILGVTLASKTPYRMSTPELVELNYN